MSVEEKDWPSVGAWVWEHFDELSGVSFLPYDGGTYRQAPYEECTEEEYNELKAKMPVLNWELFLEETDNVEGAQMLACVSDRKSTRLNSSHMSESRMPSSA